MRDSFLSNFHWLEILSILSSYTVSNSIIGKTSNYLGLVDILRKSLLMEKVVLFFFFLFLK
jgi:hypothetical protein